MINNTNNIQLPEIWKDILGYEGHYQISNLGRVKSLPKIKKNRDGYCTTKEKFLKPNNYSNKYAVFDLSLNLKVKRHLAHRLLAIAFIPNAENKPFINHKNGNKLDNSLGNLEWVSASENAKHAFDMGLRKRGEVHSKSIFTDNQVIDIKQRLAKGENGASIARLYNACKSTIHNIKKNKTWKHLNN